ncbi:hypothetical protein FOZ60_004911 [Perkinsus olseni]|uniref:Uncharacterized protein n=1 Tax=Perkinsus olseni TaxID=32597 RepID=A0A7J6PIS5_PEROL|nr:hypothetical protein FOZ60_004911 [Perkinsus olseni]
MNHDNENEGTGDNREIAIQTAEVTPPGTAPRPLTPNSGGDPSSGSHSTAPPNASAQTSATSNSSTTPNVFLPGLRDFFVPVPEKFANKPMDSIRDWFESYELYTYGNLYDDHSRARFLGAFLTGDPANVWKT